MRYDDNLIIAQVGYVANVPYFLTYALMSKGFESVNLLPENIVNSKFAKIFYGSIYNGNPLNVRLIPIRGTGVVFIINLLNQLKYFSRKQFLIAHLHIGSALRDHLFLQFLEKLHKKKIKLVLEFHGTDLRNLSSLKAKLLRYIYNTFLVSTPDLMTYCESLELPCMWLPNVVDPYYIHLTKNNIENIIYNKKHNIEKDLTIKVLIPTRLDEHKNIELFFEMLPEVVKDVSFNIQVTHIVWPETVDTFIKRVLPTYKLLTKSKNFKFKILPLQNRYDLLSLYFDSNAVIGQFKLGIGLVELEALATLNHVIMPRLNIQTIAVYNSEVPVCSIKDSSELGKCFDRIIREPANLSGLEFIERYHSIEKVINILLNYYYDIIHW